MLHVCVYIYINFFNFIRTIIVYKIKENYKNMMYALLSFGSFDSRDEYYLFIYLSELREIDKK